MLAAGSLPRGVKIKRVVSRRAEILHAAGYRFLRKNAGISRSSRRKEEVWREESLVLSEDDLALEAVAGADSRTGGRVGRRSVVRGGDVIR